MAGYITTGERKEGTLASGVLKTLKSSKVRPESAKALAHCTSLGV